MTLYNNNSYFYSTVTVGFRVEVGVGIKKYNFGGNLINNINNITRLLASGEIKMVVPN